MTGWQPDAAPGYGWPMERSWVNPSPNAPNLWMARAYAGTVMLEGTTLSEGRGTTRPLELFGAPDIDAAQLIAEMRRSRPSGWPAAVLRECWFEPTFHKHAGQLCAGVQIHVEDPAHYDHAAFRPWRLQALAFKAIRRLRPTTRCGATFPTNTSTTGWPSTSSTAARCCASGWTTRPRRPADLDALARADERPGSRRAPIPAVAFTQPPLVPESHAMSDRHDLPQPQVARAAGLWRRARGRPAARAGRPPRLAEPRGAHRASSSSCTRSRRCCPGPTWSTCR
jgi:hypothetical protein